MSEESYRKLAEHLDRLPGGFPPDGKGGELRLLATLFTPEEAELEGHGCDVPEESCLGLGDFAAYYARTGRGRAIDRAEMLDLLAQADAHNLVLQPSHSQRADFICCCCGCCCGVLGSIKRHPKPAEFVSSAFIAQYDATLCQGCETCLDRCQMDAFRADDGVVAFDADRCIGCGLCVSTCPSGALSLQRKPGAEGIRVAPDMDTTLREIAAEQARRAQA